MKPIDRTEAERLVQTYSDMILRLSYTYLKSTQETRRTSVRPFSSSC